MAATDGKTLTIGRLAAAGGVNLETIRYYEREGLLATPPRAASGYRVFPPETARIADVDGRIRALTRMRDVLRTLSERCSGCSTLDECSILQTLDDVPDQETMKR